MTTRKYIQLILILGSLTALAPFSIDMYLPGFPAIAKAFQTSTARISLSLTGFFIGISAGQLLYGPLLDRFGRRKPLFLGLLIYILASIACAFATNINFLIALRFIQAIGACAATVTAVAMVRDLFPPEDNARVFSLLLLVLGASPLVAPTIGGYLTAAFGWQSVFIVLTGMGLAMLIAAAVGLPNSFQPNKSHSLKPGPIIKSFVEVLLNPQFLTYSLTGALALSGLFVYVAGSPIVFMGVFGLSGKVYGWIFAFLSIGFIGSSQINNRLLKKYSSEQIVQGILWVYAALALAFFASSMAGLLSLPVTIGFLFFLLGSVGIANPNAAALSLAPFTKNAGTASALMGAIQMGIGALSTVLISLFEKPGLVPLVFGIGISALAALAVAHFGKKRIPRSL